MVVVLNSAKYIIDFQGNDIMQGYFNIISAPAQVILLLSTFVFKPMLKRFSLYIENGDQKSFKRLFLNLILVIAGLTAFGAVFAWVLGPAVIGFVFAAELTLYRVPITLIVVGGGFMAVSSLFYFILIVFRAQKMILVTYIFGSVASILICYVMISRYEILGASIAFALSYALVAGVFACILVVRVRRMHIS
jgi:O-antigen/teichoic acid export membrane protein